MKLLAALIILGVDSLLIALTMWIVFALFGQQLNFWLIALGAYAYNIFDAVIFPFFRGIWKGLKK